MATEPEPTEPQPSRPARIARAAAAPVTERRYRVPALFAVAGFVTALAPDPAGALGVAALVLAAFEVARR